MQTKAGIQKEKEFPAHPWWAYAGKEMILNTDYVGATLKDFGDGILVL